MAEASDVRRKAGEAGVLEGLPIGMKDLFCTEGVEPMTSVVSMTLPLRADEVTDGGYVERVTSNAPEAAHGFYAVPKVVE
jgi:Asp-tRNA(Asn)/Glu-tRNA(Gln) amidotransferase C subunit